MHLFSSSAPARWSPAPRRLAALVRPPLWATAPLLQGALPIPPPPPLVAPGCRADARARGARLLLLLYVINQWARWLLSYLVRFPPGRPRAS